MSKLIMRHDVSEANDKNLPAYGSPDARLIEMYSHRATKMGSVLVDAYGVNPDFDVIAVSTMRRAQETARSAGFNTLSIYSELDEVSHLITPDQILRAKETKQAPRYAITSAEQILSNPPIEKAWITHGLIIAGLCEVLGVANQYNFIASFCEIRELSI